MLTSPDFLELLSLFERYKVRFLIVGGYAVMRYTEPRFTKGLDILIAIDKDNAASVYNALKKFCAPLKDLTEQNFSNKEYFYQMGAPPLRVDILMSIPGVEFEQAWQGREELVIAGTTLPFIGKTELIQSKRAAGRPQDLLDLDKLESDD